MREDELKHLLREAEAGLEPPTVVPGELAERVRQASARSRERRRALVVAVPVVVLVVAAGVWRLASPTEQPADGVQPGIAEIDEFDTEELMQEIARLEAEAERHERLARALMAGHREPSPEVVLASDPWADAREQIDIVAYRMILRADGLRGTMEPPTEAIGIYRDVVRMFPNTHSAEVARDRLGALGAKQGET